MGVSSSGTLTAPASRNDNGSLPLQHAAVLLGFMLICPAVPALSGWPAKAIFPVAAYAAIVVAVPRLRKSATWSRAARIEPRGCAVTSAIAVASVAILVAWADTVHPDLSRFVSRIPTWPPVAILLAGLGFALTNATMEEIAWRGVILEALHARVGSAPAVAIQAICFGLGHYAGIPGGWTGVLLATGYGLALGYLRVRSEGLVLCIGAHVCADATIFAIVLHAASTSG